MNQFFFFHYFRSIMAFLLCNGIKKKNKSRLNSVRKREFELFKINVFHGIGREHLCSECIYCKNNNNNNTTVNNKTLFFFVKSKNQNISTFAINKNNERKEYLFAKHLFFFLIFTKINKIKFFFSLEDSISELKFYYLIL